MRTTVNLDDDVFDRVKEYAQRRSLSLGEAASELVRLGLAAPVETRLINGFHAVVLPVHSPKVTTRRVKQLL